MIIKSMSRKVPSFDQLIGYMDLGASSREHNIYYNLYSRKAEGIEKEFKENARFIQKRKNGVYLYHEVISITRSKQVDEAQQIETLRQVVYKYIQERAGENLVYAVLHDEKKDNLHYHLLISSNGLESQKKHRLSKKSFDEVKRNLELFVLECHPELQQKKLISKDRSEHSDSESLSNKGAELKRRTGKTPQRDIVRDNLERIFASAQTREELIELLESENLQLYKRGKHWGVVNEKTNRKHRFATLGVSKAFAELEAKLAKIHTQETKAETGKQSTPKPENGAVDETVKETKKQTSDTQQKEAPKQSKKTAVEEEASKRATEMKKIREKKQKQGHNFKKKQ